VSDILESPGGAAPASGTPVFVRRSSGLTREISSRSALAGNVLLVNLVAAAAVAVTIPFTFPGADMPIAILLAMVPSLVLGTVYVIFNIAMPRSGGEYLYISRCLHPSVGFAANFSFVLWNIIFGGFLANQISTVYLSAFFTAVKLPGAASAVSTHKWVAFGIGAVIILVMAGIVIVGTRFALRLMNWCFYIGMAALLATIGLIAATSHSAFRHAVSSQASYTKIVAAAHRAGYVAPHSWHEFTPTLNSVALVSLTTLFVMYSAYAGGEVRNVRRSVPIAIYGSALIGGLVFLAMAIVAVHSWSNNFIAASNFLSTSAPQQYPLSSAPSFAFFAVLPHQSVFWAVVANGGFILLVFGNLIFGFIALSRCLFAWSFDRLFPQAVASVSRRTHTPLVAIGILAAGNLIALIWYTFEGTVTFLGGSTMAFISTFLTTALAAVVFPYVRRELYNSSPGRKTFLGIPIITIAGVLTIVMLGAMVYAFLTNSTFGANGTQSIEFFIGFWVIGLVIYLIVRVVRGRQGVDLHSAFVELPPE
jgi:APA family basic amino acid/polyamine antiporter